MPQGPPDQPPTEPSLTPADWADSHQFLCARFSLGELRTLMLRLGVDPEQVNGETKDDLAREMILYFQHRGRLGELMAEARKLDSDRKPAKSLAALRRVLIEHYSLEDMRDLVFDLGDDEEQVSTGPKQAYCREMIRYYERQGRLDQVVTKVMRKHPCPELARLLAALRPAVPAVQEGVQEAVRQAEEALGDTLRRIAASLDDVHSDLAALHAARSGVQQQIEPGVTAAGLARLAEVAGRLGRRIRGLGRAGRALAPIAVQRRAIKVLCGPLAERLSGAPYKALKRRLLDASSRLPHGAHLDTAYMASCADELAWLVWRAEELLGRPRAARTPEGMNALREVAEQIAAHLARIHHLGPGAPGAGALLAEQ
jgi:hypothetical protein